MLMYRVDKSQCILTNDEIIVRFVCTEWVYRLLCSIIISLYFLLICFVIVCKCGLYHEYDFYNNNFFGCVKRLISV